MPRKSPKPEPTPAPPPARGRGRPAVYGTPPPGARRQSVYVSDAELVAVREFLKKLRSGTAQRDG